MEVATAQDFTIVSISPSWAQLGTTNQTFDVVGTGLTQDLIIEIEGQADIPQVFEVKSYGNQEILKFRVNLSDTNGGLRKVNFRRGDIVKSININLTAVTDINRKDGISKTGSTTGGYSAIVDGFGFNSRGQGIEVFFEFPDMTIKIPNEQIALEGTERFTILRMPEYSIPGTSFDIIVRNLGTNEEFRLIKQQNRFQYVLSNPSVDIATRNTDTISRYGGTMVTIRGNQISRNALIEIDGIVVTPIITQLTGANEELFEIEFLSPALGSTGNKTVFVRNPDGRHTSFPIEAIETPFITRVNPSYVRQGEESKIVQLFGGNFGSSHTETRLYVDNMVTPIPFNDPTKNIYIESWSPTLITLRVDGKNPNFTEKSVDIMLQNALDSRISYIRRKSFNFIYDISKPIITSIEPSIIPDLGGQSIEIYGEFFIEPVWLRFINASNPQNSFTVSGTNVLVVDSTRLIANIPEFLQGNRRIGFYHVELNNDDGGKFTLSNGIYFEENVIRIDPTGVIPSQGSIEGGTLVALQGANFPLEYIDVRITIGNRPIARDTITVHSSSLITFVTPPGTEGVYDVVITFDKLISNRVYSERATRHSGFSYVQPIAPPDIVSITPDHGPMVGGTWVTVKGFDFRSNSKVYLIRQNPDGTPNFSTAVPVNHAPPSNISIQGGKILSEIRFPTPRWDKAGQIFVAVRNPSNLGYLEDIVLFTYVTTISAFFNLAPREGPFTGGNVVELIGANLEYIKRVFFGDREATYVNPDIEAHRNALIAAGYNPDSPTFSPHTGTRIFVLSPPNLPGSVQIRGYDDILQMIVSPINYNYLFLDPQVFTIYPLKVRGIGGSPMTINGREFHPGATVHYRHIGTNQWKQIPQSDVLSTTNFEIKFLSPVDGRGNKEFAVRNPYQGNAFIRAPQSVYFVSVPRVTTINPTNIPAIPLTMDSLSTTISATGANFFKSHMGTEISASIRRAGGVEEFPIKVDLINENQLLLTIRQDNSFKLTPGEHIVKITNPDFDNNLDAGYVEFGIPVTTSTINPLVFGIEPNLGPHTGGLDVVIRGSGFMINPDEKDMSKQRIRVFFGDRQAQLIKVSYTPKGDQITVRTPPGTAGNKDVTILNMAQTDPNRIVGAYTVPDGFRYLDAASEPVIFSVSPVRGSLEGGYPLVINGNGFISKMHGLEGNKLRVFLGGRELEIHKVLDSSGNEITNEHPPGRIGTRIIIGAIPQGTVDMLNIRQDIVVMNPDTGMFRFKDGFHYAPDILTPRIEEIMPPRGPVGGNIFVDIVGQNFDSSRGVRVMFGRATAKVVSVTSTKITVALPPADDKLIVDVTVENVNGGTDIYFDGFTYFISKAQGPKIIGLVPNTGSIHGSGDKEITLYGENFITGDTTFEDIMLFLGAKRITLTPNKVTNNEIRFRIPPMTEVLGAKTNEPLNVTLINNNGAAQTKFTYTEYSADPTITSITPSSGITLGGTPITIIGNAFKEGAKVFFGAKAGINTRVISPTKIFALSPPMGPGTVDLTVVNGDGGSATILGGYTYFNFDGDMPRITNMSPRSGRHSGNTPVVVSGENFNAGVKVFIGGEEALTAQFVSGTTVNITTPPGKIGKADVTILNTDGGVHTLKGYYEYIDMGNPRITSLQPNEGPAAGGITITIIGSSFDLGAKVYFGNEEASNVVVVSETRITAVLPEGDLGKVDVRVKNPDGVEGILKGGFSYVGPPRSPKDFTIRRLDDFTAEVSWKPSIGARYYQLFIREQNQDERFLISTDGSKYIIRNLKPETFYTLSLNSVNIDGSSSRVTASYYNGKTSVVHPDSVKVEFTKNIIQVNQSSINVTLGEEGVFQNRNTFDFTSQEPRTIRNILVPSELTKYNNLFNFIDRDIEFSGFLGAVKVNNIDKVQGGFVRARLEQVTGAERDNLLGKLPRNVRVISKTFRVGLNTIVQGKETAFQNFALPVSLWIKMGGLDSMEKLAVFRYNPSTDRWEKITPTNITDKHLMFMTQRTGVYIIGQER
jgi:hypothetical protein